MQTETQAYTKTRRRSTGAKPVSPQTLIQKAFDDADGDRQAAAAAIAEPLLNGNAMHDHIIAVGARTVIGNLICSDRNRAFTGRPDADVTKPRSFMQPPSAASMEVHRRRLAGRAVAEVRMLLDSPLSSGKKLARANRTDLLAEANVYEPQARDMMAKVNFYRLVAEQVPNGKIVVDVLTNEALTAILAQARAGRVATENKKAA